VDKELLGRCWSYFELNIPGTIYMRSDCIWTDSKNNSSKLSIDMIYISNKFEIDCIYSEIYKEIFKYVQRTFHGWKGANN
jgi:hypothetical protein